MKFFHSVGIYALSNAFVPFLTLLTLPIFTHYLSPFDFGMMSMFGVLLGILNSFTGLSIHGAIARQYVERDKINISIYITGCFLILVISSGAVAIITFLSRDLITRFTEFPARWLWVVVVVAICYFLQQTTKIILQMQHQALYYATYEAGLAATLISVSMWLVVGHGMDWTGRLYGQLITHTCFAILGIYILFRKKMLAAEIKSSYMKNALLFGIPLIPHVFGMWLIQMTDRILITNILGLELTGIYSLGVRLGMVILFLQDAFMRAWTPVFYEMLKENNEETNHKVVKYTYLFNVSILVIAFAFGLAAPWLVTHFLDERFHSAGQFIIWISLGYAFNGMYKLAAGYIFYKEKTHILAGITFFTATVNVLSSYLLIKRYGCVGAAQGTMLAFLASFLLTWFIAARMYKMPWLPVFSKR